ncbi:16S rRNA (cytosine(967)-C(5))-methyltransferase RsmB [Lacrimispora sphenoides]|uniref:16S rRNA (cytosine(967)-C(5))-methyltransferase n=1 Tax=Lacrimispora sphenoides JCM 1415 TaxID=1297793 RepID=A0ABY1C6Z5_9FIRM|nr:16S rRNA (cytosine(967)-C(5))-methyltransferase RsmB [Lacrimispora sphenoides]SET75841.1 16S rRNA (cytosine967-C5)-methyltransferase [[Clostridium] sphenoides JCM 1415]SUY51040.1 sun protein [Lacrimispora sphenoides]
MMTKETDSREISLDILLEILERGGYSHIILRQALNKYQYLDKSERAFISRIVEGSVEYLLQIDYIIDSFSSTKVSKMKPVIRTILRMSVYQLLYMDRVPDSAVCNEAVKLAVKRKFTGLKGFVNGVLRNISRNKEGLGWPDDSVRYSMPAWIVSMWEETYGRETAVTMMESFLKNKKTTVRCNFAKASKEEILQSLKKQGTEVSESGISEAVLCIEKYDYLEGLEAFQKGYIQVQDLSSSFVGEIADPQKGDYVIDVCGAPGGKSIHIADKLDGTGMVEVRDLSLLKINMVEENMKRCGFLNIRTKVQDALVADPDSVEKADIVIADLPCSGLGIIGRKPDIKYRMTPEALDSLAALQRNILSVVQAYVKPGGRLIFSTCTINRKENEENARWFLEHFPFDCISLEGKLGEGLDSAAANREFIQLLPGIHPCDGFFIAAFQKR